MLHESASIRVHRDDQIATLWLDVHNQPSNLLSFEILDEVERALRIIQKLPCVDVLVLRSGKSNGFSPGYDLDQLASMRTSAERSAFAARGQQICQLVSNLSPDTITVAVIEGECRSAGLELALACDYRLALARPDTLMSFPEIARGLIPCWGGTQRLPRLVGLKRALKMLLKGQELSGREAFRWGLVDYAVCERRSRAETQALLDQLQDYPRKRSMPRFLGQRLCDAIGPLRWAAFRQADGLLSDVEESECPASRSILTAIRLGYHSAAEGFAAERQAIGMLGETSACKNALANMHRASQPQKIYPAPINPTPTPPDRIAIVGGGELGASLARWFALQGRQVVLQEQSDETLQSASDRIDALFRDSHHKGRVTALEADQAKKNIRRTISWKGLEESGLVIEAVDEDLGIKRGVLYELEQRVRPRTILATASSTIRVAALQAELQRPGRVAGLHFLDAELTNPIVEVVRAPGTDSGTLAALDFWLRSWRKTPILVSDRPGRLVRRLQLAYLSEAVLLVAEGLPAKFIDREMRRFGVVEGPLESIDAMGFDKLARLVDNLQIARGDDFARNLLLDRLRAFGWNGRENGEGFYRYRRHRVRGRENELARMAIWRDADEDCVSHYIFDPQESLDNGVERLVLRTINEAAACLAEERDADPGLIDLALAWGAGWAPFRGGPLRHADQLGLTIAVERLNEFAERFGKRFEPCIELQRRAEAGETFYGAPSSPQAAPMPEIQRLAG